MKKIKVLIISIYSLFSFSVFGQWNNTGDCTTTGSFTMGNPSDNAYSHLTIKGGGQPSGEAGKREVIFDFNGVKSVIKGYRSGWWASNLDFLTTIDSPTLVRRMSINEGGWTAFYDNKTIIGNPNATNYGEGNKLEFAGVSWSHFTPAIYKYNTTATSGQLRIQLGDYVRDYFKLDIGLKDSEAQNIWRSYFTVVANGNVGIGKNNPQNKLDVNGTIRAKEVRVESGWADFVFKDDYKLPSLNEVEAHIGEYKHLPGIPSEAEVKENGIGLSEISTKLLQKVEELTLYAIEQNKKIESLTKEVEELRNQK